LDFTHGIFHFSLKINLTERDQCHSSYWKGWAVVSIWIDRHQWFARSHHNNDVCFHFTRHGCKIGELSPILNQPCMLFVKVILFFLHALHQLQSIAYNCLLPKPKSMSFPRFEGLWVHGIEVNIEWGWAFEKWYGH